MSETFDRLIVPLTDAVVALFLFLLGANVGSFLNVLAHRVPQGRSVVQGGSRCPACGMPIRWRDNVPVLGWLLLRGRCRDCRAPIAPRYPIVEAVCALLVGAVASVELLSGGGNLPQVRPVFHRGGADVLLLHTDWPLVATCLLHCGILVTLLAWTLFEIDGLRVPRSWFPAALAIVVGLGLALPGVQPVAAAPWPPADAWWRGLVVSAAGILAAAIVGRLLGNAAVTEGLALVGAGLGWQATLTTAALILAVAATRSGGAGKVSKVFRVRGVSMVDLLLAALIQVLCWRWLALPALVL